MSQANFTPWQQCTCGGSYRITVKKPFIFCHTEPPCRSFDNIEDTDQFVDYSRRCRRAIGDIRGQSDVC